MSIVYAIHTVTRQAMALTVFVVASEFMGQAPALAEDTVSVLMQQSLADMADKVATVLTVDYAPGGVSDPHVHPGSVFAYVLEGSVVTQLEGELPMTYTKGQSWYEPPKKPHLVSKNASKTEPAKLLVFLLSQEGTSIKIPMRAFENGK